MSRDRNPTNPAFDAIAGIEAILSKMKARETESPSTRGLLSKRNPTMKETMRDNRMSIARYVKAIREIREKNKKDG
tara:strand:+ start:347 stop:574 length:228 start_codon:yes stop_codon:yes gene_type:complete